MEKIHRMKEIQIMINLLYVKDFNEKLAIRNEFHYYVEVFFASNRIRSKLIHKFPQDKSNSIPINQTLYLKQHTGNKLEFWFRSEKNDLILGAFSLPLDQLVKNSEEIIEEHHDLTLSSVIFANLGFSYQ